MSPLPLPLFQQYYRPPLPIHTIIRLAHITPFRSSRKLEEPTNPQSRTTDLNRQLTSTTSTHSINDTAQIKTLTDRALSAEKRANHASNQLAMLEAKLAEIQSKAGKAEDKWEARVREYENRLRVAGEKIKTEKQGGKERALQLEGQVR
jgi:predicted  nucleic acid-binding Zn-ribbon protein